LSGAQETAFDGLVDGISKQLGSPDRFVRQSAARVLDKPGDETYHAIAAAARPKGWAAAARTASAYAARKPGYSAFTVDVALRIIKGRHPPELKLEAARLMQIGLGDVVPSEGTVEGVFEGYASRLDLSEHSAELTTLVKELEQLYHTRDKAVDAELGRVIAMLQPGSAALLDKVLAPVTAESHPVDDIHQLIIAARIAGERTPQQRQLVARALLALEPKIQARKLPQDSNWDDRVLEMYFGLVGHDSALPVALLEHRDFGRPGHVLYIAAFPPERLEEAISAFVARMRADRDYPWSSEIVFLLGQSRAPDVRRMVRGKFDDFALRNSVLVTLAERPEPEDRARFVAGLEAAPLDVLTECVKALALLGPGKSPAEIVALTRTMRRLGYQKEERELRDQVVELLQLNTRQDFGYVLGRDGDPQQPGIDRWTAWVRQNYADEYGKQDGGAGEDLDQLRRLLARVDWDHGDATRGAQLFETRACSRCHGSRRALGPDLAGVAGRFSREDLFVAIALPNRDVSPRYQTTMIATHDGQIYTGLIVYESVDGLVLRDGNNRTFRIETEQIESRRTLATSLMPAGLLKDLVPQDLSDLNAYLRGLGVQTAKAPQADSASE
jgi:putative heme-binding domain-containing protein